MKIFLSLASALMLITPAAFAAEGDGATLTLKAPIAKAEFIIDGAVWYCEGTTCTASSVPDLPPAFVCAHVVRVTGAVESFTIGDKALSAAQLATCNSKAKA